MVNTKMYIKDIKYKFNLKKNTTLIGNFFWFDFMQYLQPTPRKKVKCSVIIGYCFDMDINIKIMYTFGRGAIL